MVVWVSDPLGQTPGSTKVGAAASDPKGLTPTLARRERCLYAALGSCPRVASRNDNSMNRFEKLLGLKGEARLRFLDGEFQVLSPGDFVRCAVTGEPIMLPDLRYWSVELQEAYANAEISFERTRTVKARARR